MKIKYLLLAVFLIPTIMAAEYTCQGNETVFIPNCIVQAQNITLVPNTTEYERFSTACYDFLDALYNRTEGVVKLAENYANCVAAGEICSKDLQEVRSEKVDFASCQINLNAKQNELDRVKSEGQRNMLFAAGGALIVSSLYFKKQQEPAAATRMDRE